MVSPAGVNKAPETIELPETIRSPFTIGGAVFRTFQFFYGKGVTPHMVVRSLGPWGHKRVESYVQRRFGEEESMTDEEREAFKMYLYHTLASPGSGEYAIRHVLDMYAFAKRPLQDDMGDIKVPVSFYYGANDWMDRKGGDHVASQLKEGQVSVRSIPKCGHQLFLQQPYLFCEAVEQDIQNMDKWAARNG